MIANTGGLGVWRCDESEGARITGAEGWLEGTAITILEEGTGSCAGWLRAGTRRPDVSGWS